MSSDAILLLVCLVISFCLVAMTISLAMTSRALRRTLRKADQSLDELHALLGRTNRISERAEHLVQRARGAVSGLLDWLHISNGTRAEPRPNHRRSHDSRRVSG